ncbi:MAG: hypothetical protein QXT43_01625 [Candidatus Micrarchaeaceae archaeon]
MNLIEATLILAIAIIAIVAISYFLLHHVILSTITESQAKELILNDLQKSSPGATIILGNVTPSIYKGSWHVVVSIIKNYSSPCPSYYVYAYDYPRFGFIPTNINNYTGSCKVNGYSPGKPYLITSSPVAITFATSSNISSVASFINKYGYANVSAYAEFYNETKIENASYTDVWLVNYTSKYAKQSVEVLLSQLNGTVLKVFNSSA